MKLPILVIFVPQKKEKAKIIGDVIKIGQDSIIMSNADISIKSNDNFEMNGNSLIMVPMGLKLEASSLTLSNQAFIKTIGLAKIIITEEIKMKNSAYIQCSEELCNQPVYNNKFKKSMYGTPKECCNGNPSNTLSEIKSLELKMYNNTIMDISNIYVSIDKIFMYNDSYIFSTAPNLLKDNYYLYPIICFF